MTSDAKIGLLLGLVFIFIIAFLINGLPSFRADSGGNELTKNMVSSRNDTLGMESKERIVIQKQEQRDTAPEGGSISGPAGSEVRFKTDLPQVPPSAPAAAESGPGVATNNPPTAANEKELKNEVRQAGFPKTHVVGAGENLTSIAKKFYGADEGNKIANVNRMYQANRNVLKSPDEVYEGQKLVIPAPEGAGPAESIMNRIFSGPMFEKSESIGKRRLGNGDSNKQLRSYVIREGDTLWRIAAEQLGDGSRYREIAKLNAGVLEHEDKLLAGVSLKLPPR